MYFVFKKTDISPTKAFIPVLNTMEWAELIGRKRWYAFLLFIPIVNIFIFCGMAVDLVRSFGKYKFADSALAVIYAPAAFFKIAFNDTDKYLGPTLELEKAYADKITEAKASKNDYEFKKLTENNPYKKSAGREWIESIVFAVFAAAFIRMFLVEAYIIPTPSMEGSLLVGDFLFVSKASYGIRTPQTVAMFPLLHNVIPFLGTESYLKKPSLPYYRLPKLGDVKFNDPFVFNWPAGDSIYFARGRTFSAEQIRQYPANHPVVREVRGQKIRVRPVDKRDHYIKRCLGLPGDSIQIIDRQVYKNGAPVENPSNMQFNYILKDPNRVFSLKNLKKHGITPGDVNGQLQDGSYSIMLTEKQAALVKELFQGVSCTLEQQEANPLRYFPNDPVNFKSWTLDNYGPIYIPKKGDEVVITAKNIALYRRVITAYEGHTLDIKNGRIYIDGQQQNKYTFEQDYYWAVGDNRHASEDSRFWGFVPFDHIVGKPIFIWMSLYDGSLSNGIRWNRLFKSATDL